MIGREKMHKKIDSDSKVGKSLESHKEIIKQSSKSMKIIQNKKNKNNK